MTRFDYWRRAPLTRDPLAGVQTALEEAEAYFEERADAEYFTDSPSPAGNDEMRLLVEVQVGLKLLKEVRERITA